MTKKELFVSRRDGEHTASALLNWYDRVRRPFPWRETTDPYKIWISEVMLQQTPVDRVVPAWAAWLERWPAPSALAAATRTHLRPLTQWQIRLELLLDGHGVLSGLPAQQTLGLSLIQISEPTRPY